MKARVTRSGNYSKTTGNWANATGHNAGPEVNVSLGVS
jgi:hypothetical protein